MAHSISGIDHVLVAVEDLTSAAAQFARLGFVASPRGGHPEWGTANHCLMLADGYVELLAPAGTGPGAEGVADHLRHHGEGLMGVALGSLDADRSYDGLARAGVPVLPPTPLSRPLQVPEGDLLPRFVLVGLADGVLPGLPAFLCQHLTPELLRRPEWLAHPNTAHRLVSLTVVVDDPGAAIAAYDRVFGPFASTPTDEMVTVHTGAGLIFLVKPDGFEHLHPDLDYADEPPLGPAALTLAVRSLEQAAQALTTGGIAFRRRPGRIAVDPAECLGIGLELVAD